MGNIAVKSQVGLFYFILFCLFVTSCGLDTFYYLDPIQSANVANQPEDPSEQFFSFTTASNSGEDIFVGTSVYYRLYNSENTMNSNITSINSQNEEYSDDAMNRLLSLGFQPISLDGSEIIVPAAMGAVPVTLRLFNNGNYNASVMINEEDRGVPLRTPNLTGFSFYPTNSNSPLPKESDGDTSYTQSQSLDSWYIAAYGVSVGRSLELTPVYSQVVYLGNLIISP